MALVRGSATIDEDLQNSMMMFFLEMLSLRNERLISICLVLCVTHPVFAMWIAPLLSQWIKREAFWVKQSSRLRFFSQRASWVAVVRASNSASVLDNATSLCPYCILDTWSNALPRSSEGLYNYHQIYLTYLWRKHNRAWCTVTGILVRLWLFDMKLHFLSRRLRVLPLMEHVVGSQARWVASMGSSPSSQICRECVLCIHSDPASPCLLLYLWWLEYPKTSWQRPSSWLESVYLVHCTNGKNVRVSSWKRAFHLQKERRKWKRRYHRKRNKHMDRIRTE